MTISTKPEDIDSPETILHYMESYPASGQNRAAAKLIRELLAGQVVPQTKVEPVDEQATFEAWWADRKIPDNMKCAFYMVWKARGEIVTPSAIKEELAVTCKLLEDRDRVLKAIPECPDHGPCVPHAIEWIKNVQAENEALKKDA